MSELALDYETAKEIARNGAEGARATLAADPATAPELLYFLSQDASAAVRRAVAGNPATPRQADSMLSRDSDHGVRVALARKAVGVGLSDGERKSLWRMTFTLLETLATDAVVQVRRSLSDALRSLADAPRAVVLKLARDPAPDVAVPILRSSPALTDSDLIELVQEAPTDWAQAAIADRPTVSAAVCDALVARGSVPAIATLLNNRNASISDTALERIVDQAQGVEAWHAPLAHRPSMPQRLLERIGLLAAMPRRGAAAAKAAVYAPGGEARRPAAAGAADWAKGTPAERSARGWETPTERARRLFAAGQLTEELVAMTLENGRREFAVESLALKAGLGQDAVRRILDSRSPRSITALCWKAGFTMRFAMEVQRTLGGVAPSELLNARHGIDYPLTPEQMTSQLAMFAG
ncbi:MAG: DUF2336 domain-containing protein [Rhodospirillales bacterium]